MSGLKSGRSAVRSCPWPPFWPAPTWI